MTSLAASASPPGTSSTEDEVSLVRLYVLRAPYLLLVLGLAATIVPALINHVPMARGVIPSLLGGVWLLAFIGLRYPPADASTADVRTCLEDPLAACVRPSAVVRRTVAADLQRGLPEHRIRRDSDADRHPVGLR